MQTREQEIRAPREPTLDLAGYFPYRRVPAPGGGTMLELDLGRATRRYFVGHLQAGMRLEAGGAPIAPLQDAARAWADKTLHFPLPPLPEGAALRITMNGQPVSALLLGAAGALSAGAAHGRYQLAGNETRAFGFRLRRSDDPARDTLGMLPYDRAAREGFTPQEHAPITDVHTHYSAQISGASLLEVALRQDRQGGEPIAYPVALLQRLDVYPDGEQQVVAMQGRDFNPMREEGLACEQSGRQCDGIRVGALTERQRDAILRKMDIAPDGTMGFSDFDREMYRYRNPFVKHPSLARAILKKIAEEYARMGVQYAELSTGSMMDPAWFRQMAETLDEIGRDGVGPQKEKPVLRFLVGLPRNASPQQTMLELEKVKFLARHPAIVGVDLLGYESNKTSDFHWALSHMAQWAKKSEGTELRTEDGWDFKRDFIIRVHAGETAKNPNNVGDAIDIAHRHGVRVRVGHALHYRLDAPARAELEALNATRDLQGLANPDLFATERCMDSNQVYRTMTLVHHQPPPVDAPCFLSSDGGGAIGTGPVQLAYGALAAGWTLDDLARQRRFEEGYIDRQAQREAIRKAAFDRLYGAGSAGLDAFLEAYRARIGRIPRAAGRSPLPADDPSLHYLPEPFHGKRPIFIGGASGNSWAQMDAQDRDVVTQCIEALVQACDPKKVYFVLGRVQKEGVSRALDRAVMQYNDAHPEGKFAVLGRSSEAGKAPNAEMPESITWIQDIPQGRDYVPASMLYFIRERQGGAVLFGGSDYTAEIAYGAPERDVPHALHEPRSGKMALVAETAETDSVFHDLGAFRARVLDAFGAQHFFRSALDRASVLRDDG